MTEQEWLVSEDSQEMLEYVKDKMSERKLRLFACACCRGIWHLLTDEPSRRAVEIAEKYADGLASAEDLDTARGASCIIASDIDAQGDPYMYLTSCAVYAASHSAHLDAHTAARGASYAATAASRRSQTHLLRDIVGNPFQYWPHGGSKPLPQWPDDLASWLTSAVLALARSIYEERRFDEMPILGDALEEAGCDNEEMLKHCRNYHLRVYTSQSGIVLKREWLRENMIPHVRGCWLLDLLLGFN